MTSVYHVTPLDKPVPLEEALFEGLVPVDPRFPGCFSIDPDLLAEDNMRLAKQEGANVKRKIAPIGVSEDQLFWVMDEKNDAHLR